MDKKLEEKFSKFVAPFLDNEKLEKYFLPYPTIQRPNSVAFENYLPLTKHYDPRVRVAAIQALCQVSEQVKKQRPSFSQRSYQQITELCVNSDRKVRLMALKLLTKFAEYYPEEEVISQKGLKICLVDDAFSHLCHAMNDLEVSVRAEAARLMGSYTSVTDPFLHQTLDKKLISQMKVPNQNVGTKVSNSGDGSIWNVGKTMGEDVPLEKVDEEGQSMIPTGACGAFITALEDEFMAVRQAGVYSLGLLAKNRPSFASSCIDHLADMFNDEIQQVRLDAIRALTPLISYGTLQKDQLNTILTALDDATADNRLALHDLLAKSKLADSGCVVHCLHMLLRSMHRFPLDKFSIYKCLSSIGLHHASLIQPLVIELLGINPVFDTPEQNIDDDFYLAKLILVLNAASKQPAICSLIPEYVKKHYRYLRRASPNLIPVIWEVEETRSIPSLVGSLSFQLIDPDMEKMLVMRTYEKIVVDSATNQTQDENDPENVDVAETSKSVKVMDPTRDFQNNEVIHFAAGIPTGIPLRCILTNLTDEDLRNFRIQVEYPDQSVDLFRPRPRDFLRLNDRTARLQTTVVVNAQRWAIPASILLRCGIIGGQIKTASDIKSMTSFVPFPDAEAPSRLNKISVNIHPMLRA